MEQKKYKDRKLEKAVGTMGLWAIRYCLSRNSFAFFDIKTIIQDYWPFFNTTEKDVIIKEFHEALNERKLDKAQTALLVDLLEATCMPETK